MSLIPTILCGGAGSRLWPVSRERHPKAFHPPADGQSLLQKAFLRGASLPNVEEILTVTNRELYFKTEDEFKEVNRDKLSTSFILEPCGRNTAAAIAAAALHAAATHGKDVLMLVLAADHLITTRRHLLQRLNRPASWPARASLSRLEFGRCAGNWLWLYRSRWAAGDSLR
jgi:mannose-1-phosphate guanylyltransferase/mannose-6-phosphate isomerase